MREGCAEETGTFAALWSMLEMSSPIVGGRAVLTGWLRTLGGVLALVYGVLSCFLPEPFEASLGHWVRLG